MGINKKKMFGKGVSGGFSGVAPIRNYNFNNDTLDNGTDGIDIIPTSITFGTGKIDESAVFDGSSSKGSTTGLDFSDGITDSAFSMNYWIKFNTMAETIFIANKFTNSTTQANWVSSIYQTRFQAALYDGGTANRLQASSSVVTTGTWYMVTITYDGSGNASGLKIYLNGSFDVSATEFGTYGAMTGSDPTVWVGVYGVSPQSLFKLDGDLDMLSFFDYELSSDQSNELWNSGAGLEL